jgi:hypothetical protein
MVPIVPSAPTEGRATRADGYVDAVTPSVDRIAGQLSYLFEDRPELRNASPEQLAERLNHDDRYARARERYPFESDAEVAGKIDEFDERITVDDVRAALEKLK